MPNYLTKEEIRQWRSSLEKITLEEYAARLGKTIEESKSTNDVVDIVMTRGTSSNTSRNLNDGFSEIAERAFARERQLSHTPFSIRKNVKNNAEEIVKINVDSKIDSKNSNLLNSSKSKSLQKYNENSISENNILDKVQDCSSNFGNGIVLKKVLTDREQIVFEYFLNHIGETVFAKDLAALLELPRDYIYKYIKNLRAKIEGDKLRNVPSGGFVLVE